MKISLLLTGNELMSGDTVDSNSAYIAQSLKDLSLVPYIKKVVTRHWFETRMPMQS